MIDIEERTLRALEQDALAGAALVAGQIAEAAEFFSFHAKLKELFELMCATGLGYLQLGQGSQSLSGGEAQRLKLVSELAKGLSSTKRFREISAKKNCYFLEEPTIGLHASDCQKLIELLHDLIEQGHTIIVIEHDLDIISEADYVIEIGPNGGEAGGHVLYQGDFNGLKKCKQSQTAEFL